MQLIDVKAGVALEEIPLQVRMPQRLNEIAPGVSRIEADVPSRRSDTRYFNVEHGIQSLEAIIEMPRPIDAPNADSFTPARLIQFHDRSWGVFDRQPTNSGVQAIDERHHVGPLARYESVFLNPIAGLTKLYWDNRGDHAEYETPYDSPAPDVPIHPILTLRKHTVVIEKSTANELLISNKQAATRGRVEFLSGRTVEERLTSSGAYGFAVASTWVEVGTAAWRLDVRAQSEGIAGHVFAVDCTVRDECQVAAWVSMRRGRARLLINRPKGGEWRVVVLPNASSGSQLYNLRHVALKVLVDPGNFIDFAHATTFQLSIPPAVAREEGVSRNSVYAVFRNAPVKDQNEGMLGCLTFLSGAKF